MKKILVIVLVSVLVSGIGLSAFASGNSKRMKTLGIPMGERGSANRPAIGPSSEIRSVDLPGWVEGKADGNRSTWNEVPLIEYSYGQGQVDAVRGPDGNLWAVFFDDRNAGSGEGTYYMRSSTDGGHTWVSPFTASGFILTNAYPDYPSLAMRQINASATRIVVAVTGSYNGYPNTVWAYKNIGTGSWSMTTVQTVEESYRMPRIVYSSNGSTHRLQSASVRTEDGNFFIDTSTSGTTAESWLSYYQVSTASPGFAWVFQPDLAYYSTNNYLFFVMNGSFPSPEDENKAYCLLSLSTNQGTSFRTAPSGTVGPWSVGSTSVYSYENSVVEVTQGQTFAASKWLIFSSFRQSTSAEDADIGFVYGNFSAITFPSSTTWNPGTVFPYTLKTDTDGDEAFISMTTESGTSGKYHVSWLDENPSGMNEVWYTWANFSDLASWLTPEIVTTSASAMPNVQNAASTSIILGGSAGSYIPVVCWADSRNATVDVYSAYWSESSETATPTSVPTTTPTPSPSETPVSLETYTPTATTTSVATATPDVAATETPEPTDTPSTSPTETPASLETSTPTTAPETPTETVTPDMTDSPTATGSPVPVPSTGPAGISFLVVMLSLLLFVLKRSPRIHN